jgi:hypothetical protein
MTEAIAEALQIIEVQAKIQFLTLEAKGTQVVRFPSKDAKTIGKAIKGVEDEPRPPRLFDQFCQGVAIGSDAIGAEIKLHRINGTGVR